MNGEIDGAGPGASLESINVYSPHLVVSAGRDPAGPRQKRDNPFWYGSIYYLSHPI